MKHNIIFRFLETCIRLTLLVVVMLIFSFCLLPPCILFPKITPKVLYFKAKSYLKILGIKLNYKRTGVFGDDSPSVDKIIPELGYVPGNVCVISQRKIRFKYGEKDQEAVLVCICLRRG